MVVPSVMDTHMVEVLDMDIHMAVLLVMDTHTEEA